jgi:hypothetical protein
MTAISYQPSVIRKSLSSHLSSGLPWFRLSGDFLILRSFRIMDLGGNVLPDL